mgnify:CR=1 FL=1|jgi:hypothetical protein
MSENNEGAKKERKNLGAVFLRTNKEKPTSFDITGHVMWNNQKIRLCGYKKFASGEGKMAKGTEFYAWYRVEPFVDGDPTAAAEATAFNPEKLEA